MKTHRNPLLDPESDATADTTSIAAPVTFHRSRVRQRRREIRDLRRQQSAVESIEGFSAEVEIYGYTKGQFSLIDLLQAAIKYTGPIALDISTWTAAHTDVTTVLDFVDSGLVTASRWLVDLTFQRRSPELAKRIRDVFGPDAIRVAKNHAKFLLLGNDSWKVVVQTSMNLNFNPRFENFSIAHDPELYGFHESIISALWKKQHRDLAHETPYQVELFFARQM